MDGLDPGFLCHSVSGFFAVAGEHGGGNAQIVEAADGRFSTRLQGIRDGNMACFLAVNSHINHRAADFFYGQTIFRHQLTVAAEDSLAVHHATDTPTGQFFDLLGRGKGQTLRLGGTKDADGNGMGGILLTGSTKR